KQIYSGVFFSCRKLSKDIFRSLMLDNLSDESFLVPTKRGDKTGTTFIFPFADIKNLVKQSEEEIDVIEDFERRFLSIARNEAEKIFFPSIANSSLVITFLYEEFTNKKLETKFDGVLNKNNLEKVLSLLADDASYEKGFDISKHAKYTTNTIKRRVTLRIPDRQYHGKKTEEFIPLKLIEVDMDKMADDLKSFLQPLINRVLCARDGMIIEPKKIDIYPRVDFIGLLDVRKDNPENEKSQDFLRSSESIKHNKWKATETRLRNIYGNTSGPKSLRDFFKEINRIVNEEFGIEETDTKQLPKEILSEIFKDLGIRDIGTRIKEKEDKKLVPEYLKKQRIREKKQTPSPSETKPKPKRKTVSEKDVFNLHPKFLFRNLNEIGVEIYLPENRSYVLNLTLTPTVTSYDKQVEIQLPFDIYDNKENRIKDYSKISEINFPLKALISLETIPLRLRDIAIIGLSIMGEN
ncbi:MAG: hypothetical protein KAU62_14615, partial [Candidatus Heimdallarchaeota archaeon]|nr:hypothetical protein [Candidatus Heimdallarchaeota archaeon]